jgi:hypothetical protein
MAVEAVSLTDHWVAWVDEERIRARSPVNRVATRLAHDHGIHVDLRGTVVLPGFDGDQACSIGLADDQIEGIGRRLRTSATSARPGG